MKIDALIDHLAGELVPTRRAMVPLRVAAGVGGGALISGLAVWFALGVRPDLGAAVGTAAFWVKFAYTAALAGAGFWAVERLARPAGQAGRAAGATLLPILAVAVLAVLQFLLAPTPTRPPLVIGHSANLCPWLIVALSLPMLAGLIVALRTLAPTRLTRAGFAAGLLAGAAGAWVYAFHCDETGMPFLALWYSLGIAGVAGLGAAIGRFALRW